MRSLVLSALLGGAALMVAPHGASAASCAELARAHVGGVEVTAAEEVRPDPVWNAPHQHGYNASVRAPFCRVQARVDGRIGVEVWLPPADKWNHRLLGAGVGGDAGIFNYADLARGVEAGYAGATTDSGHKDTNPHWMLDRDAVEDYAERAEHRMTEAAKALVAAYYGLPARHAYFLGCSGGGRQALKELQVFPDDYDGIVAGAGGPYMPTLSARHMWEGLYQASHPQGALTDGDWALVANAATRACDGLDGVVDGVVENQAACRVDLEKLRCVEGKTPTCLTEAQLSVVRTIAAPLRDETGRVLDDGVFPGVRTRPGPPSPLLREMFADGAHHDPNWDERTFKVGADLALALKQMPHLAADDPDLRRFAGHGGKVLLYQGWLDPSVIAEQSLDYYGAVERASGGPATTRTFARLFMVPGMLHCRGGPGADSFGGSGDPRPIGDPDHDILSAVVRWVEEGRAPERITAAKLERGKVVRTHPLCPYPLQASYLGGDSGEAESFRCGGMSRAPR